MTKICIWTWLISNILWTWCDVSLDRFNQFSFCHAPFRSRFLNISYNRWITLRHINNLILHALGVHMRFNEFHLILYYFTNILKFVYFFVHNSHFSVTDNTSVVEIYTGMRVILVDGANFTCTKFRCIILNLKLL